MGDITQTVRLMMDARKATTQLQQVGRKFSSLKSGAVKLGAAVGAIFALNKITAYADKAAALFDTQAKAERKLLVALKGREDVQQTLIRQAQDLQKVSLFGDEATIEAQAFLAKMQLSTDAILKLTPLVQDLATAQGIDLKSAADLVAKSVGSSTNALSRYGITITGAVGSAERLETAVQQLNLQVGGQAEEAAKVGTGAMQQLENQLSDLEEEIGQSLIPTLLKWKKIQLDLAQTAAIIFGDLTFVQKNYNNAIKDTGQLLAEARINNLGYLRLLQGLNDEEKERDFLQARIINNQNRIAKNLAKAENQPLGKYKSKLIREAAVLKIQNDLLQKRKALLTVVAPIEAVKQYSAVLDDLAIKSLPQVTTGIDQTNQALLQQSFDLTNTTAANQLYHDTYVKNMQDIQRETQLAADITNFFGSGLQDVFYTSLINGENFFKQMGEYLKKLAAQLISAAIAAAALAVAFSAIGLGSFSFATIFTKGGGFLKLLGNLGGIPGLASGGITTGATLAMVGEGREQEAILPLSKLENLINTNGGGGVIIPDVRISGNDLLLIFENAKAKRVNRYGS